MSEEQDNLIDEKLNLCTTREQLITLLSEATQNPKQYFKNELFIEDNVRPWLVLNNLLKTFEYKVRNKLIVLDIELPKSGDDPLINLQIILQTLKHPETTEAKSKGTKQAKLTKPPNMPQSYREALQSLQKGIETATTNKKILTGKDREIYYYLKENVELFDYDLPKNCETWLSYIRKGRKIEEAQKQYLDEIRTKSGRKRTT